MTNVCLNSLIHTDTQTHTHTYKDSSRHTYRQTDHIKLCKNILEIIRVVILILLSFGSIKYWEKS